MVYTIFDVQAAKDHIGETVIFGSCVGDFSSHSWIGELAKVHDEFFIREPYEDQHGNVFPIIKTINLPPKLLDIIATLNLEEREQLYRYLKEIYEG